MSGPKGGYYRGQGGVQLLPAPGVSAHYAELVGGNRGTGRLQQGFVLTFRRRLCVFSFVTFTNINTTWNAFALCVRKLRLHVYISGDLLNFVFVLYIGYRR